MTKGPTLETLSGKKKLAYIICITTIQGFNNLSLARSLDYVQLQGNK
jgi:hypothetical protein